MKNGCANRMQSRARSSYAEVKPAIDEVNEEFFRHGWTRLKKSRGFPCQIKNL